MCETRICVRRSSGDRRLIRSLSKDLLTKSTTVDRERLYPPRYFNLTSREHDWFIGDWTLLPRFLKPVPRLPTCESCLSPLLGGHRARRLQDFRSLEVWLEIQRPIRSSSWFDLSRCVFQRAPRRIVVKLSSSLFSPYAVVRRVGVALLESREWSSKSRRSHPFFKQALANSRSLGVIRSIPIVRRSIKSFESQSLAWLTTRRHQASPHSSNIVDEFLCCPDLCLGALGSLYIYCNMITPSDHKSIEVMYLLLK